MRLRSNHQDDDPTVPATGSLAPKAPQMLRLASVDQAVALVAVCPMDRLITFSIVGLGLLVQQSGLPMKHVDSTSSTGMNPFFMAVTAFAVQLAVVSGIVLSLGVLRRSGSTRRGKSGPMMRLIYDCGTTWIHICSACCFSYTLLALDVFPAVVIGERPVYLVRVVEWIYTVPLVWYVYARVYTAADEQQLDKVKTANVMMLVAGFCVVIGLGQSLLYIPLFALVLLLFGYQAEFLWRLPANGSATVSDRARWVYLVGQFLMSVYPVVWICGDLSLVPAIVEQVYIYTFLDVLCKLVLVWSCIVLRFIQAFPVLHTCFEGSQQFLDASHDVRLTVDSEFCICDVDGKSAMLQHYLSAGDVMARCFLGMCHSEAECRKFMRAVQTVDRQSSDTISPKVSLALSRDAAAHGSNNGSDAVSVECVVSGKQNGGLRLIGITFHELALDAEGPSRRQVSQVSAVSSIQCGSGELETRQLSPSVLEMDSASCVGSGSLIGKSRRVTSWRRSASSKEAAAAEGSAFKDHCDQKSLLSAVSGMSRRSEASMISTVSLREHVEWVHMTIGQLLEHEEEPAFLADMMSETYPIVGCSEGFLRLTQYTQESILGTSLFFLEEGVPDELISKSSRKDLTSFCQACRLSAGTGRQLGDLQVTQPSLRAGGAVFVNCCLCSLVMLRNRPYILGVPTAIAEGGFAKLSKGALEQQKEESREKVRRIREKLVGQIEDVHRLPEVDEEGCACFFSERLQDHCILMGYGRTALRREPYDLPNGCMVFCQQSSQPCEDRSLRFSVLVDDVTPKFDGLPLLGFTLREPCDTGDCYPRQAHCLAQSVSIGRNGEAFARDQNTHVSIGFKLPPQEELMTWCLDADRPPHLRRAPCRPEPGDILECIWRADGHLELHRNGAPALSFDTGRCPKRRACYYGFVDVCLSVSQVTLMPFQPQPSSPTCSQGTMSIDLSPDLSPVELKIRSSVLDMLARQVITAAVADCPFCVTVADPGQEDCPLVAVSSEFLRITGYRSVEVLGRNCRFLNEGCPADPSDIMALRHASKTGQRVTLLLTNRRSTGELFVNLLDLAGITVAKDLDTGEDIWYLIGVQADCTHLAEGELPKDHLAELKLVGDAVRNGLERELRQMALDSLQDRRSGKSNSTGQATSMENLDGSTRTPTTPPASPPTTPRGAHRRRVKVLNEMEWCGHGAQHMVLPPRPVAKAAPPRQASGDGSPSKAKSAGATLGEDARRSSGCGAASDLGQAQALSPWLLSSFVAASAVAFAAARAAKARR